MIIELFGVPGSGKSYCCEKIKNQFEIVDITYFFKEKLLGKILFHVFLKTFKMNKELKNIYNELIKIIGDLDNYNNILDNGINVELYLRYMIFIYFLEEKCKKNIIVDEGIIHYSIVLHVEFLVEIEKIEKIIALLNGYSTNKLIFGLKCNKEDVLIQIKKRNRKRAPIDFLAEEDLNILLDKYYNVQSFFLKRFQILDVDNIYNEIKKIVEEKKSDKI